METYGVFDGGEGGDGAQRGQFVKQTANRSAIVAVRQAHGISYLTLNNFCRVN